MVDPHANGARTLLRHRDGHHARVTYEELFFDLVYVFAVTQISHELLHNLTLAGVFETLILWFAVWLGWQYTCWFTNWFDPERPRVRGLLFVTMLLALVMASSIPEAYGSRGLVFAISFAALQAGRTAVIVLLLPRGHALGSNYARMLGWLLVSAVFWISGGLADGELRVGLWIIAVLCEYVSPMFGFALPFLGRSRTRDWTIEGGHLAERCQLFVIVALGETLLASGANFAKAEWNSAIVSALLSTFLGTLAMWWLYFGTTSKDASEKIVRSDDPGRIGAYFHYVHAVLIAGIIGCAVANDLVLEHPHQGYSLPYVAVLIGGPAVYLLGSAIYKKMVYGRFTASHVLGAIALLALVPVAPRMDLLTLGWMTTLVLLCVALWDLRRTPAPVIA
jgi:low temperature requirement protein LtrA